MNPTARATTDGSIKELESSSGSSNDCTSSPRSTPTRSIRGLPRFFATLGRELDDDYFGEIAHHLRNGRFRDGMLVSARLGEGNQGVDYVLRARRNRGNFLRHRIRKGPTFSCTVPREDAGATKP